MLTRLLTLHGIFGPLGISIDRIEKFRNSAQSLYVLAVLLLHLDKLPSPSLSPGMSVDENKTATPAKLSPPSSLGEGETPAMTGDVQAPPPKDFRFWALFASLLLATLLAALDLSALATALPTIAQDLRSREFTWIGTSYSVRRGHPPSSLAKLQVADFVVLRSPLAHSYLSLDRWPKSSVVVPCSSRHNRTQKVDSELTSFSISGYSDRSYSSSLDLQCAERQRR